MIRRGQSPAEESLGSSAIPALHSDRGPAMASQPVAFLIARLGITKTHSRPHVSNHNSFSESQFKTLRYGPEFPERLGSIEDATTFCRRFSPGTTMTTVTAASG